MGLKLNRQELLKLMENFHILTGIKLAVFDSEYREMVSYPPEHCAFCAYMRSTPRTEAYCEESNRRSFEMCKKQHRLIVYRCHAGLIEATAPLEQNGTIFGYIMFGQITDDTDAEHLQMGLNAVAAEYGLPSWAGDKLQYKTSAQIEATAEILKACTSYLLLNEIISPESQQFIQTLDQYIETHLTEDLNVAALSRAFSLSRTKLYEISSQYLGCGVAQYVLKKRIAAARQYLSGTDLTVTEVAACTGFSDYNYFCRVFRRETGISARTYRKGHRDSY